MASTESIATGVTVQRTIALYDASGIQLEYLPYSELVRIPSDAESNTLRFFGMRGGNLVVRPVPMGTVSGALTHIYRAAEPRLLTGTDTPLMPQQFQDGIADRAASLAMARQGDEQGAKYFNDLCEQWVQSMIENADRFSDSTGGGARSDTPVTGQGGK